LSANALRLAGDALETADGSSECPGTQFAAPPPQLPTKKGSNTQLFSTADQSFIILINVNSICARLALAAALTISPIFASVIFSPQAYAQQAPRTRAWLGVIMDDSVVGQGVLIKTVMRKSPAEAAHLRSGDRIVTIDSQRVIRPRDVINVVANRSVGENVELVVLRASQSLTLQLRLEVMPVGEALLRSQLVGQALPPLTNLAQTSASSPAAPSQLRGNVTVLDFWAPWCGACRAATPTLNGWSAQFGSQGLKIYGIAAEEVDEVREGIRRFGMQYPAYVDRDGQNSRLLGVSALPSILIIDKHGIVRDAATGYDPARYQQIESLIGRLLAEP
jgi:thiol-disulfide isomerase/thioredoxin